MLCQVFGKSLTRRDLRDAIRRHPPHHARSRATRRATSTSTRGCWACGSSRRRSTRTTRASTTCSTATRSGARARTSRSSSTQARIPAAPGAGMVHRDRLARRLVGGARLLGRPARGRGRRRRARRGRSLRFADLEGLGHELVVDASGDPPLVAEHPEIPPEHALQGFEGVRAYSDRARRRPPRCSSSLMGAAAAGDGAWELRGDGRGGWIALDPAPSERRTPERRHGAPRRLGHDRRRAAALARAARRDAGVPNSGIVDRHYFHSIYFREPGGMLFELADGGARASPSTARSRSSAAGHPAALARAAAGAIEARLTPLPDPRADWVPVTR